MKINLENITDQVVKLSHDVAAFISEHARKFKPSDVEEKGVHDLVSYVDRTAEEMILEGLAGILPEAGFIAEESGMKPANSYNWIVDPLDGTTNFVHGVPLYAISIALQANQETIAAVVLEVNQRECFSAWKGGPAFLNGNPIHVSNTRTLHNSLIATGFPYTDYSRMSEYLSLFDELMRNTRGLRRLGSAAVDLAYVACGRFDVFYEYGLKPWDVAAGAFIVEQAGGTLSCFNGSDNVVFGKDIIASNGHLHEEILKVVSKHFKA